MNTDQNYNLVSGSAEIHMGIGEEKMIYELNNNASVLIEKGEGTWVAI